MKSGLAYSILAFYSLLTIIAASVGHYFDKTNGFSYGYVFGACISLVLWFTYGKKMSNA
jgi:hypothetical protein